MESLADPMKEDDCSISELCFLQRSIQRQWLWDQNSDSSVLALMQIPAASCLLADGPVSMFRGNAQT